MMSVQKTALHRCRDCKTVAAAPQIRLCARCRAAVAEKRKARKREKEHERYCSNALLRRAPISEAPHSRAATSCRPIIEGQAYTWDEDTPPEPPTSLSWLDNFHPWATSGLSYAAYQKQEWLAKEKAAALHKDHH